MPDSTPSVANEASAPAPQAAGLPATPNVNVLPVASEGSISRTATALREGKLAILPTDTVYGVAADIRHDNAVRALYAAKGKSPSEPLQLLFATGMDLTPYARFNDAAQTLITALGPGPWTIITPVADGWTSPALAGGDTVGIRIPPVETLAAVLTELGAPVAASSANRHHLRRCRPLHRPPLRDRPKRRPHLPRPRLHRGRLFNHPTPHPP